MSPSLFHELGKLNKKKNLNLKSVLQSFIQRRELGWNRPIKLKQGPQGNNL